MKEINSYPHEGGCPECREARICNACGGPLDAGHCTNGRCSRCHAKVCVSVGLEHGYGKLNALIEHYNKGA